MEKDKAQEDLQFIRRMLDETRRTVADNGLHYINWSIMPAIGIIGTYLIVLTQSQPLFIFWLWVAVVAAGWIISYFLGLKGKNNRSRNFAERILSAVWVGAGITMTITAFAGMLSESFTPQVIPAMIATIMGIPYLISGMVYDLKWFKSLAVIWWIAGLCFFFLNSFHTLGLLGLLMILCQTVPGFYLYKTYGNQIEPATVK